MKHPPISAALAERHVPPTTTAYVAGGCEGKVSRVRDRKASQTPPSTAAGRRGCWKHDCE
ncbi:hypothetical protein GCM10023194_46910 [Planotetraspora phitsanulokensis]